MPSTDGYKKETSSSPSSGSYDQILHFPADKYPETAAHIQEAIESGESAICTINRANAEENREESLADVPTKSGYDRDEWPMAMCAEGGAGADIEYISPSDNRGAGSWVGNQLEDYSNGTRVLFIIDDLGNKDTSKSTSSSSSSNSKSTSGDSSSSSGSKGLNSSSSSSNSSSSSGSINSNKSDSTVFYQNCTAVRNAGKAPLYEGDPGYSSKLDRDHDGVACE
ncbi:DNA-entry nuclease [Cohnella sp. AR92]|nr:DNA-entry nuclease [Cohnella sp. AR92]